MALEHIFWDVFILLAFTTLQGFIYQVLQCFKFGCWHITYYLVLITYYLLRIANSFIKNRNLLINIIVRKKSFPVEVFNWVVVDWGCWLFILRKLRQFPQKSFFILFFFLASNGCWPVILRKLGHFPLKKSVSFFSSSVISKHKHQWFSFVWKLP